MAVAPLGTANDNANRYQLCSCQASLEPHLQGGSLCLGVLLPGDEVLCPHLPIGLGRLGPPSEQVLVRSYHGYRWLPVGIPDPDRPYLEDVIQDRLAEDHVWGGHPNVLDPPHGLPARLLRRLGVLSRVVLA